MEGTFYSLAEAQSTQRFFLLCNGTSLFIKACHGIFNQPRIHADETRIDGGIPTKHGLNSDFLKTVSYKEGRLASTQFLSAIIRVIRFIRVRFCFFT